MHGLLWLVKRRWAWIAGAILICELLAVIITAITKPTYEATTTIELNKGGSSIDLGIGDMLSDKLSGGEDSVLIDQQTEAAVLHSDSLALSVIQGLSLTSQPSFAVKGKQAIELESEKGLPLDDAPKTRTRLLQIFESALRVNPIRGTRLIEVTYRSHDPRLAAQIANALIDSYKKQYLQSHYEASSEASNWLTKQLSDLKANVVDSEKKLTDYEKASGILSLNLLLTGPSGEGSTGEERIHSVVIQKLDQLNSELTAAETNRIEKEAIYHLAQTNNGNVILGLGNNPLALESNSMVLNQGGGLTNLQVLERQRNEIEINLADASNTYGAKNRHLKEMQTQLQALDGQIKGEIQLIVKRAQADYLLAQQTEDGIRRRFDQQQDAASSLNEKAVQFAVLSQEAFSRKKLYEDLYTKLQEANVSAGIKATNITVVDPARSESIPVRPKLRLNAALGMLFGVFLGMGTAFFVDIFDRTVSDAQELEVITGVPVIGTIPDFDERGRAYGARLKYGARRQKEPVTTSGQISASSTTWVLSHPDAVASEALRALRTSILLSRVGRGPKIILVTSCVPGEGKTTITSNLAVTLAQQNKKVVVIDADMRRPMVGRRFQTSVDAKVGLSNVLSGSCTSEEAILCEAYVPTLDILPAGPRPPRPADMLGSEAFDQLLQQLASRYDIVLIDSPPALLVTDAVALSNKADAVIWVALSGAVTRPQLGHASRLIEQYRMPVIGFVLNRMNTKDSLYGYNPNGYYGEDRHET